MFEYFWESYESISEGHGFGLFSLTHIAELLAALLFIVVMTIIYKKADREKREKISLWFVYLVIADEIFKHVILIAKGNWLPNYLPLHLCSINIFMIVYYHYTKNKLAGNFLWCLCIPGALLALLFPNWKMLPVMNFMHLHSETIHVLLLTYPIMLFASGDIKRDYRLVPKMMLLFAVLCIPGLIVNLTCGTNFMFLMEAPEGSPLVLFEKFFGNHLWGFVILLPIVVALMYVPYKKPQE